MRAESVDGGALEHLRAAMRDRLASQRVVAGTHSAADAAAASERIVARVLGSNGSAGTAQAVRFLGQAVPLGTAVVAIDSAAGTAFVYDLSGGVDDEGLMTGLEHWCRDRHCRSIRVNVFEHDTELKAIVGLREHHASAIQMRRDVDSREAPPALPVELHPMSADDFESFRQHNVEAYARDLVHARMCHGAVAEATARGEFEDALPDALATPGQELWTATEQGRAVGSLWIETDGPELFIRDLEVAPGDRRRGVGRAIMQTAQRLAHDRASTVIRLSVFGFNFPARALYSSLGYQCIEQLIYWDVSEGS